MQENAMHGRPGNAGIRLFLCGDVMTGRGIDQILRYSVDPRLYEPWITDARDYVALAETLNGPIERPVDDGYVWGDALGILDARKPDARIINLETAITDAGEPWPRKGIHYRMHPANSGLLQAAGIDCCVLANNHVLDWGYDGLGETLQTLERAGIRHAGAGPDAATAAAPAIIPLPAGRRLLVFALAFPTSGVPHAWRARADRPGVNLVMNPGKDTADAIARHIAAQKRPGDIVVASIHWGGNWGYEIAQEQRQFAHALIDAGAVDVVHGHSSHHPVGIEVYRDKLVLYGCGDLLNDYEGIEEHGRYRGDLSLMYFPVLSPQDGRLLRLEMHAMQIRKLRLNTASQGDTRLLQEILDGQGANLGTGVDWRGENRLRLSWH
ncbi:MAG: CapA family protein [Gammaproteobacteria bacterium]